MLEAAGDGGTTVLAGIELARFGLGAETVGLVERLGARFVTTVHAKAVLPETHPAFAGVYIGALGRGRRRATRSTAPGPSSPSAAC